MLMFLLISMLINNSLETQSRETRQQLQASAAANQLALAINRVAAAGDGTQISFFNTAGPDVVSMDIFVGRSLQAGYSAGGYVTVPLSTNKTKTNLVAYWAFNSADTPIYDGSGEGNSGTCAAPKCPTWTNDGYKNGAYSFDGSDDPPEGDFITAQITSDRFERKQGTFSAWLYVVPKSGGGSIPGIVRQVWGGSTASRIYIQENQWTMSFAPANGGSVDCQDAITPNSWQHIAVVSQSSSSSLQIKFYINGVEKCSVTSSEQFFSGQEDRIIGKFNPGAGQLFKGTLDEVRIYNRALSAQEIRMMAQGRAGAIPLNQQIYIRNVNGTVYIEG